MVLPVLSHLALKTNTTLTNFFLSDNKIGPAGAESLATVLKANKTLKNLDLLGNNLGPAGGESVATALKTNTINSGEFGFA